MRNVDWQPGTVGVPLTTNAACFPSYCYQEITKEPMNKSSAASFAICIVMDIIGYATYAVPVLGEFGDIVWAPISAFIFYKLFGGWKGAFGGLFNFVEEILPGLDFIPSFTLMWMWQNHRQARTTTVAKVS